MPVAVRAARMRHAYARRAVGRWSHRVRGWDWRAALSPGTTTSPRNRPCDGIGAQLRGHGMKAKPDAHVAVLHSRRRRQVEALISTDLGSRDIDDGFERRSYGRRPRPIDQRDDLGNQVVACEPAPRVSI